jgi:probable rRNA maturation factor
MSVEITDLALAHQVDRGLILAAAEATLRLVARSIDELSVVLLEDKAMTALNLRLLGRDEPTDVIAFEAERDPDAERAEIYVNLDAADRQAAEYGHSIAEELAFLVAHGVLHALGYDDSDDAAREAMFALQERAVAAVSGVASVGEGGQ